MKASRLSATAPQESGQSTRDSAADAAASFVELRDRYANAPVLDRQSGQATYYGDSLAGNHTANGEVYDPMRPTMAHRTLPFGTIVRITRVSNGAAVVVRVTDRGPFGNRRRIADLSREAARRLDMFRSGVVEIQLDVLKMGSAQKRTKRGRTGSARRR